LKQYPNKILVRNESLRAKAPLSSSFVVPCTSCVRTAGQGGSEPSAPLVALAFIFIFSFQEALIASGVCSHQKKHAI
jgi:hypothetical protein